MPVEKLDLNKWPSFSSFFLDYAAGRDNVKGLFGRPPQIEAFKDQIKAKGSEAIDRELLAGRLEVQYQGIKLTSAEEASIHHLRDKNTFTITTGHQLNIFTGPLYFIYKIVTVINTCELLAKQYPQYHFVPVYWMASEDHDFAEINHFRLFGNTHTWVTDQKGAVGRFDPSTLAGVFKDLPEQLPVFPKAYSDAATLSGAVRAYIHELFGHRGLVSLDADDAHLKGKLKELIREDIFQHTPHKLVTETNSRIEAAGHKAQVYVRDINFFYLDEGVRERLEADGTSYRVVGTDLRFSKAEMIKLIEDHPERFSPNVVLRPLYQEMILPNLAYVGGPAEVVYWLQLKVLFKHLNTEFPILLPRNFVLMLDGATHKKIQKTGVSAEDLFKPKHELINDFTIRHAAHQIQLNGEKEGIENYFNAIRGQVERVDKSLGPLVSAEAHKTIKSLEKIEEKLLKAEKRFLSEKVTQLETLKDRLFPDGNLQERVDNFLNFYLKAPDMIDKLCAHLDPFDFRFHVITLQDQ